MIDQRLRNQLANQQANQQAQRNLFKEMFSAATDAVEINKNIEKLIKLNQNKDLETVNAITKMTKALVMVFNKIPGATKLPSIFNITGKVEITNLQKSIEISNIKELESYFQAFEKRMVTLQTELVKLNKHDSLSVDNFNELEAYFISLGTKLSNLTEVISKIPTPKIEIPKMDMPVVKGQKVDMSPVIEAIEGLEKALSGSSKSSDTALLRKLVNINQGLLERPVLTTPPVTNINVNALEGFVFSSDNTVGSNIVSLPNYGQLFNRRALIIYNNSSNTIFIGGSGLTVANGMPIAPSTYSPVIDAGYNMTVYGVASQGGNDVRVMEVSKDQTANTQE